ncbi:hypothetical protein [Rhizosaccharibacter radicis]|uniref:Uncharacterized protein n=1 Tax=Rhizosaccharibacter radicis TaxID=2782605 RepID=A0ABT1W2G2_9PROT|nr:hypothetical protein [Acetobacteraceae bacterium KSS12]
MQRSPIDTGVDHVHAHPRHTGQRRLDLLLALLAIFISAVSLFIAVEHGRTERELVTANARLVEANSWPFLQIEENFSPYDASTLSLRNAGVGPAKLVGLEVRYRGRIMTDEFALLHECCGVPEEAVARRAFFPRGIPVQTAFNEVISPRQVLTFLTLPPVENRQEFSNRFIAAGPDITYRACYCSVFDQCWMSDMLSLKPQLIPNCPPDMRNFNQDQQRLRFNGADAPP